MTADAGLLAFPELEDALDLTSIASDYLQDNRTDRNTRQHLAPLFRQSIYPVFPIWLKIVKQSLLEAHIGRGLK